MKGKNKKKRTGLYIAGSLILDVGAVVISPKIIGFMADQFNSDVKPVNDEDDWGPEIVRKAQPGKEKPDGEL